MVFVSRSTRQLARRRRKVLSGHFESILRRSGGVQRPSEVLGPRPPADNGADADGRLPYRGGFVERIVASVSIAPIGREDSAIVTLWIAGERRRFGPIWGGALVLDAEERKGLCPESGQGNGMVFGLPVGIPESPMPALGSFAWAARAQSWPAQLLISAIT